LVAAVQQTVPEGAVQASLSGAVLSGAVATGGSPNQCRSFRRSRFSAVLFSPPRCSLPQSSASASVELSDSAGATVEAAGEGKDGEGENVDGVDGVEA